MTAHSSPALRLKQGVRALAAFSRPVPVERAAALLTAEQLAVFQRMVRSEQLHSLAVLESACAADSIVLAQAALLHDAGKSCYPVRLWQRALPVLVAAISKPLLLRLSARDPRRLWSRGFAVYVHHPEWGAELAAAAGSSDEVIWLVRHHADSADQWRAHPLYPLLLRLQAADDAN